MHARSVVRDESSARRCGIDGRPVGQLYSKIVVREPYYNVLLVWAIRDSIGPVEKLREIFLGITRIAQRCVNIVARNRRLILRLNNSRLLNDWWGFFWGKQWTKNSS